MKRLLVCKFKRLLWSGLLLYLASTPGDLCAQPSSIPREDFWVPNYANSPFYLAEKDGILYVSGWFNGAGRPAAHALVVDFGTGAVSTALPELRGPWVTPDQAGGWYTVVPLPLSGGETHFGLAHMRSDQSLDADWTPSPILSVFISAIGVGGNKVFVAGRNRGSTDSVVVALDSVTGKVSDLKLPAIDISNVTKLAVSDNALFVAGYSSSPPPKSLLAAFDIKTGQRLPWNPITSIIDKFGRGGGGAYLADFAVTCDKVFVGGAFTEINGEVRNSLASFDRTTGRLMPWNPNTSFSGRTNVWIHRVIAQSDIVCVNGNFDKIGGESLWSFAALDSSSGKPLDWRKPDRNAEFYPIALSGNTLYGTFDGVNELGFFEDNLRALDATTGNTISKVPLNISGFGVPVISGNLVLLSGNLTWGGVRRSPGLMAFDTSTGKATDWNTAHSLAGSPASGTRTKFIR